MSAVVTATVGGAWEVGGETANLLAGVPVVAELAVAGAGRVIGVGVDHLGCPVHHAGVPRGATRAVEMHGDAAGDERAGLAGAGLTEVGEEPEKVADIDGAGVAGECGVSTRFAAVAANASATALGRGDGEERRRVQGPKHHGLGWWCWRRRCAVFCCGRRRAVFCCGGRRGAFEGRLGVLMPQRHDASAT